MAPKQQNQHESLRRFNTTAVLPLLLNVLQADDETLCGKIDEYYFMGITDTKMAPLLQDDFKLSKAPRYVSYAVVEFLRIPAKYFILVPKPSSAGERNSD
jgi:hypothetical protein